MEPKKIEEAYQGWYAGNQDLSKIMFGKNTLQSLLPEVNEAGRSAYLITSKSISSGTDLVEKVRSLLGATLVGVFDQAKPHSPRRTILEATRIVRQRNPDCIISLGGGSATDTAKSIRLALWMDIDSVDGFDKAYLSMRDQGSQRTTTQKMLSQISLPTTLVGAEYSAGMGITDEDSHTKQVFRHTDLQSRVIILDPELTIHTPQKLWISTGIKSLEHAIAKLTALDRHPLTDATAALAVKLLASNLPRSAENPDDLNPRGQLQVASWLSMFSSGSIPGMYMGLSHALGRQIGSVSSAPHGLISSVILPLSMEYNAPVSGFGLSKVAQALGVDVTNVTEQQASQLAVQRVRTLITRLGLPQRLREIGVRREDLLLISERTMNDISIGTNPRRVEDADEVLRLITNVW